jgi:hypothetical protein
VVCSDEIDELLFVAFLAMTKRLHTASPTTYNYKRTCFYNVLQNYFVAPHFSKMTTFIAITNKAKQSSKSVLVINWKIIIFYDLIVKGIKLHGLF